MSSADAWIAATALVLSAPLVTNNPKDYRHLDNSLFPQHNCFQQTLRGPKAQARRGRRLKCPLYFKLTTGKYAPRSSRVHQPRSPECVKW